jgi:Tol biopolymer transport system component
MRAERHGAERVGRAAAIGTLLVLSIVVSGSSSAGVRGSVPATNGRIAFIQHDWDANTRTVYLIDPDGTDLQELSPWRSEFLQPRWSPDGSEIDPGGDACGVIGETYCAAAIVDPDTGAYRWLPADPIFWDCTTDLCGGGGFGCPVWSPDGALLACSGSSEADPSVAGIYTLSSSDGSDPTRILRFDPSRPWEDFPAPKDFSPDGQQLLYVQVAGERRSGLFLINLDGSDRRRITPTGMLWDHDQAATFSPDGEWILFTAFPDEEHKRTAYLVRPDGTELHEAFPECGGRWDDPDSIGCAGAAWSPDGTRVIYLRNHFTRRGVSVSNIVTSNLRSNPDGLDLQLVFHSQGNVLAEFPDWGTHPAVG